MMKKGCVQMALNHFHYFVWGNTAKGFYPLLDSNLQGLEYVFILDGGPKKLKSTLLKQIGLYWEQKKQSIEWLHSASDHHLIDGIIIRNLRIGIIDGSIPIKMSNNVTEKKISFQDVWDLKKLLQHQEEIGMLKKEIEASYQLAYETFSEALEIHDDWEKIYIQNMDFQKANCLTQDWIHKLIPEQSIERQAVEYHRFLGAATPIGPVDFIDDLTKDVKTRYLIKGRPGSGKSTMLKKIAHAGLEKGFDVEIYHCGFDPNSLDMVIIRELEFAIFDSTSPHEYFPSRENDSIIDMYEELINGDTDERYAQQIKEISSQYSLMMKKGTSYLNQVKIKHNQLEQLYEKAINSQKVHEIKNHIFKQFEA